MTLSTRRVVTRAALGAAVLFLDCGGSTKGIDGSTHFACRSDAECHAEQVCGANGFCVARTSVNSSDAAIAEAGSAGMAVGQGGSGGASSGGAGASPVLGGAGGVRPVSPCVDRSGGGGCPPGGEIQGYWYNAPTGHCEIAGVVSCVIGTGYFATLTDCVTYCEPPGARPVDQDGSVAASRCDKTKPFDPPQIVSWLNSTDHDTAKLSADELEVFVTREYGVGASIYRATRNSRTTDFGTPIPVAELTTVTFNYGPSITADGLTGYINQLDANSQNLGIFITTRQGTTSTFSPPQPVTNLSDAVQPYVSPDGQTLYFQVTLGQAGHLYRTTKGDGGVFGAREEVIGTGTANRQNPVVTKDGLTMYFEHVAGGGSEVWRTTRARVSDLFGEGAPVTELQGPGLNEPTWISEDECVLYFSTSRDGGPLDIWSAQRPQ